MANPKKSGNQEDRRIKVIILITAILNLVKALIDLIRNLTG